MKPYQTDSLIRPQEKPAPPPAAPAPAPAPAPAAVPPPAQQPVAQPTSVPEPAPAESQPEPASQGWEEPTTVQAPTWDDEPAQQAQSIEPAAVDEPKAKEEEPAPISAPAPVAQPEVASALPSQVPSSTTKLESVQAPAPMKPATPAQHTRPTSAALRHKFKADQAVIMPSGSFSSLEKVGMQFGSLSLGGDELDAPAYVALL